MATATRPMTKDQKFREIWRIGREFFFARITRPEWKQATDAILTDEPELDLGLGTVIRDAGRSKKAGR